MDNKKAKIAVEKGAYKQYNNSINKKVAYKWIFSRFENG